MKKSAKKTLPWSSQNKLTKAMKSTGSIMASKSKTPKDKMITPKTLPMGKPAMTISIIPVKKTSNNSKKKKGVK